VAEPYYSNEYYRQYRCVDGFYSFILSKTQWDDKLKQLFH